MRVNRLAVRDFLIFGFAAYGALWTVVESFGAFFENSEPGGILGYAAIVFFSVVFGIWRCWPKNHIELQIPVLTRQLKLHLEIFLREEV